MDAPHLWIPKLKIIEAQVIGGPSKVAGYFTIEALNRFGQVKRSHTWKQLITNNGMQQIAVGPVNNFHNTCKVGTGAPTFNNASVGLASPLAAAGSVLSDDNSYDTTGVDGYRWRESRTFNFTLGSVDGNLTEVGVFQANNNTTACFLDLIRDSGGSPTTFPVDTDDQLRVTHTLDIYPYQGDTSGSFSITGSAGSGSHDYLARARTIQSAPSGNSYAQVLWGMTAVTGAALRDVSALGSITESVTGTSLGSLGFGNETQATASTADNITWTQVQGLTAGLAVWNHVNGIGAYQRERWKVSFDPVIPKFASSIQRILTLSFLASMTRL